MSVVVFAYHNMGCMGLEVLLKHNVDIAAVFTYTDSADENCWFGSVLDICRKNNIAAFVDVNIKHPYWKDYIARLAPDVIFSFYYRDIIPSGVLDIPKHGAINLHGSLLPLYRGRCPVNWQLVNGETKSGVTFHYMEAKADTGDIAAQQSVVIDRKDTAKTLFAKLEDTARELFDRNVENMLCGRVERVKQDHSKATVFGGRKPEDGRIKPDMTCEQIYNLVRAVTDPYPGAFIEQDGKKHILWKVEIVENCTGCPDKTPGRLFEQNSQWFLKAVDGGLKVLEQTIC